MFSSIPRRSSSPAPWSSGLSGTAIGSRLTVRRRLHLKHDRDHGAEFDHLVLEVKDPALSVRFYSEVLGLDP